jgi:hypothetical protein
VERDNEPETLSNSSIQRSVLDRMMRETLRGTLVRWRVVESNNDLRDQGLRQLEEAQVLIESRINN